MTARPRGPGGIGAKGVFFDRDGVLNEVVYRDGIPASPRSLEEFVICADAAFAAEQLRSAGFRLFVVTNQPDVVRGLLPRDVVLAMNEAVRTRVPVDDFAVCFHDNEDACGCRKPQPGMLEELARQWSVDLCGSYIIGDTWRDVEAGRRAGCRTILLRRAYNEGTSADHAVDTLAEAVAIVLGDGAAHLPGGMRGKA